jgi:hypothetical protein
MTDLNVGFSLITQILDGLNKAHSIAAQRAELRERPRLFHMLSELVSGNDAPLPPPSNLKPFSTSGNTILYNGKPFKFAGCNVRELAYYGTAVMPYASDSAFFEQLDTAKQIGFSVVRFYAFHVDVSVNVAIDRTKRLLDALQARGMFGIVVLTDCAGSPFMVREKNPLNFYTSPAYGLSHRWYGGGYGDDYLPAVKQLVKAISNHPAIFSWEIGNELRTPFPPEPTLAQCQAMLTAFEVISEEIRALSPEKMISTGFEHAYNLYVGNAYSGERFAQKTYDLPCIDIATVHSYQDERGSLYGGAYERIPFEMAIDGIPIILEETGLITSPAHLYPVFLQNIVDATITRFSGYMQWGFSAPNTDVGSGGGGGMARTCDHGGNCYQWANLVKFWSEMATRLKT